MRHAGRATSCMAFKLRCSAPLSDGAPEFLCLWKFLLRGATRVVRSRPSQAQLRNAGFRHLDGATNRHHVSQARKRST
jgi:hypothetical protein